MTTDQQPVVLTLYPNNVGLAYVVCEGMMDILDDGIQKISPLASRKFIKHTRRFLDYAKPDIVILKDESGEGTKISKNTQRVIREIKKLAEGEGLIVYQYSRTQIKEVFAQFNATKKYAIAHKLVTFFKHLKPKMPHYRSFTKSEHYQMGLFDAYSLMVTHFYLSD